MTPIPWTTYFERELFLPVVRRLGRGESTATGGDQDVDEEEEVEDIVYHAYLSSPAPDSRSPLFVVQHGAGSSALSFAVLAAEIRRLLPGAGVLSADARGHGLTEVKVTKRPRRRPRGSQATATTDEAAANGGDETKTKESRAKDVRSSQQQQQQNLRGELDLSISTLTTDLAAVVRQTRRVMGWKAMPPVVLVGHSLGGAVATRLASRWEELMHADDSDDEDEVEGDSQDRGRRAEPADGATPRQQQRRPLHESGLTGTTSPLTSTTAASARSQAPSLLGLAVLDVVEGSALDALQAMHSYLATRPSRFASLQSAVEWHVRTRTVRNAVSARASVPALLVPEGEPEETVGTGEEEEGGGTVKGRGGGWKWRTDLVATQPFWEGWFAGLSKRFLSARAGKLLLLAGTDRLDTELTIGQMQGPSGFLMVTSIYLADTMTGKYALQVFPEAGHFIHEDLPERTATVLVDFYRRNDRSSLVLPPKVSDLLKQGMKV